jgi:tetratricopeptide (TPR) repeat protein
MDRSISEVWNCPEAFEFVCSKKWKELNPTDLPNVRYCGVCSENVYWSDNPEEFVANSKLGRCVAVPRQGMPLDGEIAGRVSPEYYQERQAHKSQYQFWRSSWNIILNQDPFFILFLIRKGYPDALELFVELVNNFPEEQELLHQAYQLLSNIETRDKFALYLLDIGQIDQAIAICRTLKDSSQIRSVIWKLVQMNRLEEALKICPMIESNRIKHLCISAIADKMADLGQIKQAIDLYNSHLDHTRKGFQEIESNVLNQLTYLQPLDVFNDLSINFPIIQNLVDKALELFSDEKTRREFALYLLKSERFEQAIAIAETLKNDSNFLTYMLSRLREIQKFEEAKQILLMVESGKAQFDGFLEIATAMESLKRFEQAIDLCQWGLTNIKNMPDEAEHIILSRLQTLNRKIAERKKSDLAN